ncbi:hypothetical protein [Aliarcobacter skirrowii]|uniref:hypothetical protein n=1 Tax=Aliarcobacter skirrowii TaxID=28200 RepID=UPI0029A16BF1|nr:hypothetical protein [Aliarcobacter skirrowii]MDX4028418.1 hypothetical protein [Aliarcobacter skirrowii]
METDMIILVSMFGISGLVWLYITYQNVKFNIDYEKEKKKKKQDALEYIDFLNKMFLETANNIKYRIRKNHIVNDRCDYYLDILVGDYGFCFFEISKDKKIILTSRPSLKAFILDQPFVIKQKREKSVRNYVRGDTFITERVDDTNYGDLYISNGGYHEGLMFSFEISNSLYSWNEEKLQDNFNEIINSFYKVFHDISGKSEHPEVRANKEDEAKMDTVLVQLKEHKNND